MSTNTPNPQEPNAEDAMSTEFQSEPYQQPIPAQPAQPQPVQGQPAQPQPEYAPVPNDNLQAGQTVQPQTVQPQPQTSKQGFDLMAPGVGALPQWWGFAFTAIAVLTFIGCAMPWASAGFGPLSVSVNGFNGDGFIILVLNIVAGVFGTLYALRVAPAASKKTAIIATVCFALSLIVFLIDMSQIPGGVDTGFGMIFTFLITAAGLGLGIYGIVKEHAKK